MRLKLHRQIRRSALSATAAMLARAKTRSMVLALLGALVASLTLAAGASAGGGNSEFAHLCQQGGWMTLRQSNGAPFTSDGECVSYGAHGGKLGVPWHLTSVSPTTGCPGATIKFTGTNFSGTEAEVQWFNPGGLDGTEATTTAKVLSSTSAEAPAAGFLADNSFVGTVSINHSNTVNFTFPNPFACLAP